MIQTAPHCTAIWDIHPVAAMSPTVNEDVLEPGTRNKAWVLVRRPEGVISADCVRLEERPVDTDLEKDELLVRVEMLSVDAFIRTTLDQEGYHTGTPLNEVLPALGYGVVLKDGSGRRKPGTRVLGMLRAQTLSRVKSSQVSRVMPFVSPKHSLGLLGLTTGLTAWMGIFAVARKPRRGEVVVVSAAAGAVGSVAAQLAKRTGAKVIGIAGGEKKCDFLLNQLKLDGAVDYKSTERTLGEQLDALAPDGVDFFYDNVGGATLDAVLLRLRPKARVVICGAVSQYSGKLNRGEVDGPREYLKLAERGASMTGFNVMQHIHKAPLALIHIGFLMLTKRISLFETIEIGISRFGAALNAMFVGGHVGKLLVDVGGGAKGAAAAA